MQEVTEFIDKNEIIKQMPLFSEMNWFESWAILPKLTFFEYKKGEVIYNEGDPPDAFYLLVSGRLQLSTRFEKGQEKTIEYLTRGKYFGIISILTGETHSVSVKALNDSLILRIQKEDFNDILKRVPKLAVNMSKSLSHRLRRKRLSSKDIFETKIISVYSAVGVVGRSIYAANLSLSLKKETGKKVILLDTSPQGEVIAKNLGLKSQAPTFELGDLSFDEEKLKESIIAHSSNVDLLCVNKGVISDSKKTNIGHLLSMLMKDYHYIIIDLPASLENAVYEAFEQSDLIHIVTDSEKESLSSTRAFVAELKNSIKDIGDNIFVIVNEAESEKVDFFGRKKKKVPGEKIYASLPAFDDLQKTKNCFMAVLECPDTKYAKAVRSIAREIGEVLIGLALSGGSAFGFAHIGVLKVFEEEGIEIDVVVGTSIGALVGGLWCCGISAAELEKLALRFRNKLRTLRLFDFTFPRRGLTSGKHIVKLLEKYIKGKTFEDTKIPLKVTACDLESRQEVIFEEGSVVKAIRASIAIPGVFEPLEYNGRFLIDGGVLQPAPIAPLIRLGVSKIIVVNVLPSQLDVKKSYQKYIEEQSQQELIIKKSNIFKKISYKLKKRIRRLFFPNIFDAIVIAMQATESILAEISCKQSDVCLHPDLSGISWFEFYKAKELIRKGQEEARRCLPQIKALLSGKNKL